MIKLTKFESNLVRFQWVLNRMAGVYVKFPQIQGKDPLSQAFRSVNRETIIIQAHNFLKIRKDLIKEPKLKKIDACLEPFWKPIIDLEEPIRKLRNNYIAHVQDKKQAFKELPGDIIDEYQLPNTWGAWLFIAGCIIWYGKFIDANFKKEWDTADRKYRALIPIDLKYSTINLQNYKDHLNNPLQTAMKNLKENNFKSTAH